MVTTTVVGFLLFGLFPLFSLGAPPPLTTGLPASWQYEGCLPEPGNGQRVFPYKITSPGTNTPIQCINECSSLGYNAAGVEYADECWCGHTTDVKSSYVADSQCNMACDGDSAHSCGGSNILNVYFGTASGSSPPPLTTGLPANWQYKGCLHEPGNGQRVFPYKITSPGTNTPIQCINECSSLGYNAAGVEYADECWCGHTTDVTTSYIADSTCNMACDGDPAHSCGGSDLLNVYFGTATSSSPPPLKTGLPANWQYEGCLHEPGNGQRVFPYKITSPGTNTPIQCINQCSSLGYNAAGVEYADECWCGHTTDVTTSYIADSTCNMACDGDPAHSCGGSDLLNVYFGTATSSSPPPLKTGLPANWQYEGCLHEPGNGQRVFPYKITSPGTNTPIQCINQCSSLGYNAAGVEYADECWCGHTTDVTTSYIPDSTCNMACDGDPAHSCGGSDLLNVYFGTATGSPPPPLKTGLPASWQYEGCLPQPGNGQHVFAYEVVYAGTNTPIKCINQCSSLGYSGAGVENGNECWCGYTSDVKGSYVADSQCNVACDGDSGHSCGASYIMNVYFGTPTSSTPPPLTTGLPASWQYKGCLPEPGNGQRVFAHQTVSGTNTPIQCINHCASGGFNAAGVEYADECWCGQTSDVTSSYVADSQCSMACSGDSAHSCGGSNLLNVYFGTSSSSSPSPLKTGLPGNWQYAGCLNDPPSARVFPYSTSWPGTNTPITCMNLCGQFGYSAAGLEYGKDCWCGDVSNVHSSFIDDSHCTMPCDGDPAHTCGGPDLQNVYFWPGLTTWHTPANAGLYQYLVPGVVVPIAASVSINNKVLLLEKHGSGPPNSTGAYELDLTLVNDFGKAYREMHVQTDLFCSANLVLPDKAARQITLGGFDSVSLSGVRLYTPDGGPGVNGTNDWEENYQILGLQRPRWYPTSVILANGSILTMSGLDQNQKMQGNLEILPKPVGGDTVVNLDWLQATGDALYPFLSILPSQNIFVGYYNEARILDPITFATVTQLPNMPGAVHDPGAGRNYPLSGSFVPLPQFAPFTAPVRVFICGGATFPGEALDNCVSMEPEAINPTWTIERMPSVRVMPCMVLLPDGTVLILNGAHHGTAGFAAATDPNFNAILYDPTLPVNSRFSILSSTTIARMYHSEATLLPDGRVLISGSDPLDPNFPEEYRIEVFIPPYLNQGLVQPTFQISIQDWVYNGLYDITNIHLFQGTTSTLRISILAAPSSTHGNAMGARILFPAFTCVGTMCTITAPPNAGVSPPGWYLLSILDGPTPSVSQWIRIGGDPSQLGNWPNLPGFTRPGV